MLATFVIGLREGLEAALIVGIIAAFLRQSGRADALRRMWLGVAAAVVLCLLVGVGLQVVNSSLPQRQQEMLECVVAAIAVVMVSYMVLWMRRHSRNLKGSLQAAAGGALASGSATALVVMAFLAVFREGFETAVFLVAAFQSTVSPATAATGAVLGIAIALVLGYLIYRGGLKLNLSKFFRFTGVVLVLVAAGLVMSTFRAAYEAGWITGGQQTALHLNWLATPGTVQESLLTGMLGIRADVPVIELTGWLLYIIPMLAVVWWPPARLPSVRVRSLGLFGTAAAAAVAALVLVVLAPATPGPVTTAQVAVTGSITAGTDPATGTALAGQSLTGTGTVSLQGDQARLQLAVSTLSVSGSGTVALSGHSSAGALYTGTPITGPVDAAAAGLPTSLTEAQVAALNDGRLPVGAGTPGRDALKAAYTDTWTPTLTVDSATGSVLTVSLSLTRTVVLTTTAGNTLSGGRILQAVLAPTAASAAAAAAAAHSRAAQTQNAQLLSKVLPPMLGVFALILAAFGAAASRQAARTRRVPVALEARTTPPVLVGTGVRPRS